MDVSSKVIIAVDPGKKSGIATFTYARGEEPQLVDSGEYLMQDYHVPILNSLKNARIFEMDVVVVCERFTINAQTVKNSQAPYSLEQIGILKYLVYTEGLDIDKIIFQSPSDAKRMFPNEALKKLGYWHRGGEGHALDAVRHGLLYTVKAGWAPTKLLE